jgi:hypothetical protein
MKKAHLLMGLVAILLMTKPGVTSTLNTLSYKPENNRKAFNPRAVSETAIEVHEGEQEGGGALW